MIDGHAVEIKFLPHLQGRRTRPMDCGCLEYTPPAEMPSACPAVAVHSVEKPAYSGSQNFPRAKPFPQNGFVEKVGIVFVITFTKPPMVLGPYRILARSSHDTQSAKCLMHRSAQRAPGRKWKYRRYGGRFSRLTLDGPKVHEGWERDGPNRAADRDTRVDPKFPPQSLNRGCRAIPPSTLIQQIGIGHPLCEGKEMRTRDFFLSRWPIHEE